MIERNAGVPPEKRIEFRVGVHLGDVVEESDGDLMGDGVNIAARLEGVCEPGGVSDEERLSGQVAPRYQFETSSYVSNAQIAAILESMWNRSNRPKVEVRRGALNVMRSCRWHDFDGRGASADHRTEIGTAVAYFAR